MTVRVRVPAKINLHLGVGPLRDDGYHELETVFHAVSLYDELTAAEGPLSLTITGEGADELPVDEDNLVIRAAHALARYAGVAPQAALALHKGIPVAGGMAGGSADAAAALVACDGLWGTGLSRRELHGIAADLGSDVPFALAGGTALGTGRGELLSPVLAPRQRHWVIGFADAGLSTPEVFATLDRLRAETHLPPAPPAERLLGELRADSAAGLGAALANDLQPAALTLRPSLRRSLAAGVDEGALGALVSGSGPTCFFLAEDASHAVRIAAALAGRGVCRTVRTAYGPVPGARIISSDD
ncbi:MAG: 4-(cytidine 5-diphospho)-2-C-methyl-D-erythritol kinase [Actinomycetia bacterium]|jgi:4-diphosphocytidyl-2-C-methyl-D-erythritol kinase|nr:4-(cytidine 5-diphospho)-2-C-methyl-D-erythritol kinase [Actinomycetes bacterium]MDQ1651245.1 4-diphosphocytidyl-2-C-methyl-D-erythritol kinase [Cryptosporangiaceae bacterium]